MSRERLNEMKKFMRISEGTWSAPQTVEKAKSLARLMSKPLPVSVASDKLYNLIGDDQLFDSFYDLEDHGPDTDTRYAIAYKLKEWLSELGTDKDPDWRNPWDPKAVVILKKALANFGDSLDEDENDARGKMCPVCTGGRREGYGNDCPNCNGEGYVDDIDEVSGVKHDSYGAAPVYEDDKELFSGGFKYRYVIGDTLGNRYYVSVAYNDTMAQPKINIWNDQKMQLSPNYIADLPGGDQEVKNAFNKVIFDVVFDENYEPKLNVTSADIYMALRKVIYNNFDIRDFTDKMTSMTLDEDEDNTETCTACGGTGDDSKYTDDVCKMCHGSGVKNEYYGKDPQWVSDKLSGLVEDKDTECDKCYGLGHKPSGDGECEECGGTGLCPHIDETKLDDIVENVLQEFPGQPKDYNADEDDRFKDNYADEINDIAGDYGLEDIDPEYDDTELGYRFD